MSIMPIMKIVPERILGYRAILQNTPCHYRKNSAKLQNAKCNQNDFTSILNYIIVSCVCYYNRFLFLTNCRVMIIKFSNYIPILGMLLTVNNLKHFKPYIIAFLTVGMIFLLRWINHALKLYSFLSSNMI